MSSNPPLIQAGDVAIYLTQVGLSNSIDDGQVQFLCGSVSDMARKFCDREWWTAPYSEQYFGKNNKTLLVRNRPIKAVTNVTIANGGGNYSLAPVQRDSFGNPVPAQGAQNMGFANYWNDDKAIYLGDGSPFPDSQYPNVYVQYTAGFAGQTSGAGVNQAIITANGAVANPGAPYSLQTLTSIAAPNPSGLLPGLTPSTVGGSLATGTYYVVSVPLLFSVSPTALLASMVQASNGVVFNAALGAFSAQASAAVTGPTGSIAATITAAAGAFAYIWAIGSVSGGPYTIWGLSFGQPDYSSIPRDIVLALVKEAAYRYEESKRVGMRSTSDGNQQTASYLVGSLEPESAQILKQWRRTWGTGY